MVGRNLSNLEETNLSIVIDESSSLDIGLGLVRHFHEELIIVLVSIDLVRTTAGTHLGLRRSHVFQDVEIDDGSQIVDVGDKEVLLASSEKLIYETRVGDGVKEISVAGRVPGGLVVESGSRSRKERLLVDTGVTRLVERLELNVVVGVLFDDATSVFVRVERVHEDKGNVDAVVRV